MPKLYRIKDWDKHFENNRTRELKKMQWVPVPNKQDGDGYTELLDHKQGAAHYGVWNAILGIASKCDERGTLMRDNGKPHSATSISRICRIPKSIIESAIQRLVSDDIGWVEVVELESDTQNPAPSCEMTATLGPQERALNGMEENGMEGNNISPEPEDSDSKLEPPSKRIIWDSEKENFGGIEQVDVDIWKDAYPAVDIHAQIRKARAWVRANPKKMKSNWHRFLTNWMDRNQEKGGGR